MRTFRTPIIVLAILLLGCHGQDDGLEEFEVIIEPTAEAAEPAAPETVDTSLPAAPALPAEIEPVPQPPMENESEEELMFEGNVPMESPFSNNNTTNFTASEPAAPAEPFNPAQFLAGLGPNNATNTSEMEASVVEPELIETDEPVTFEPVMEPTVFGGGENSTAPIELMNNTVPTEGSPEFAWTGATNETVPTGAVPPSMTYQSNYTNSSEYQNIITPTNTSNTPIKPAGPNYFNWNTIRGKETPTYVTSQLNTNESNITLAMNTSDVSAMLPEGATVATSGFRRMPNIRGSKVQGLVSIALGELIMYNSSMYNFSSTIATTRAPFEGAPMRVERSIQGESTTYKLSVRVRSNNRCVGGFNAIMLEYISFFYVLEYQDEVPCRLQFGYFT